MTRFLVTRSFLARVEQAWAVETDDEKVIALYRSEESSDIDQHACDCGTLLAEGREALDDWQLDTAVEEVEAFPPKEPWLSPEAAEVIAKIHKELPPRLEEADYEHAICSYLEDHGGAYDRWHGSDDLRIAVGEKAQGFLEQLLSALGVPLPESRVYDSEDVIEDDDGELYIPDPTTKENDA